MDLTNPATLQVVLAIFIPVVLAAVKLGLDRIPGKWLPVVAPLMGATVEALIALAQGQTPNPVVGLLAGSAGVGLREVVDQWRRAAAEKRMAGELPPK